MVIIPIPALTRMKTHRPEVRQLLALILLGFVHTGLTAARLIIMFYPAPLNKTEPQYTHIPNNVVAVAEMHTGILVATLVVMRPAFQAMYRKASSWHKLGGETADYMESGRVSNPYQAKLWKSRSSSVLETTAFHMLEINAQSRDDRGAQDCDMELISVDERSTSRMI
jgi:hypothetical protein